MELDSTTLTLILATLAFAGLVHGTLGLGFPMTATPLIALFMDVQSAILITLFPTIGVNLVSIAHGGHWRESIGRYWPLAIFAVLGSILGTRFLIVSDPAPFRLLLAAVILLYLNVDRLRQLPMSWIRRHPGGSMLLFGSVGGFLAGTVNVMVPVLVIFALEMGLKTTAMIQVFNLCFLSGKAAQVGVFATSGFIDLDFALDTLPAIAAAIAALLIGIRIRRLINADLYRAILRKVLLVTAVILIGQYLLISPD